MALDNIWESVMAIKNPTIKDVALAAGVSTQTISRVLNNRVDVADSTRARVLKIIAELNYSPSKAAQDLVRHRRKYPTLAP
jgi:LacI family transcriptional regulator